MKKLMNVFLVFILLITGLIGCNTAKDEGSRGLTRQGQFDGNYITDQSNDKNFRGQTNNERSVEEKKPDNFQQLEREVEKYAKEQGITGLQDGPITRGFAGKANTEITRGVFVRELIETMGIDVVPYAGAKTGFTDVPEGHELAPYVRVAGILDITKGMRPGYFGINEKVTREQAFVFLIRALNLQYGDENDTVFDQFRDKNQMTWSRPPLAVAIRLGLLRGHHDGTIRPKQTLIAAHMNLILERYHKNFQRISIVHSNDLHGRIFYGERLGELGLGKIATIFDKVKSLYPNTLLLDAGDTFHGTNYVNFSEGLSAAEGMNLLGYDAMTAGNHDFNFGHEQLSFLEEQLNFPIVSANVVDANGHLLYDSHLIIEKLGKKIAIVGLTSPETAYKTHPKNVEGITFRSEFDVTREMVSQLKGQVDHIILLSHLGLDVDEQLAKEIDGIDLILGGHSHSIVEKPKLVNGTYITQAFEHGKALGISHMLFHNNKLIGVHGHLARNHANLQERSDVLQLLGTHKEAVDQVLNTVIGNVDVRLNGDRRLVRTQETNLGNLVTDAMREGTGADIAITNGGGIRANIEIGDVTKNHVVAAFPFLNTLISIELSGQDILSSLEHSVRLFPEENGGFLQVSGLTFEFDPNASPGNRVSNVQVGGEPLDLAKNYSVATNDFLASGGDGYSSLRTGKLILDTGEVINQIVIRAIQSEKPIPELGRIIQK